MEEPEPDNLDEWTFPYLDPETRKFDNERFLFDSLSENLLNEDPEKPAEPVTPEAEELKIKYEQELAAVKELYAAKTVILYKIIAELNNISEQLNEEFIQLIEAMVKRVAYKIIGREIQLDPTLMPSMIEELKNNLQAVNGPVRVYISSVDYEKLELQDPILQIQADEKLAPGDIVIKSNYNEINALLSDRIERLMRINNE